MVAITGTQFNDWIHRAGDGSSSGANEIDTVTTGSDSIDAAAGADLVLADAGNDTVLGGTGNDTLFGGSGSDRLEGGDDNDLLVGGANTDRMLGGDGYDTFRILQVSDISGLAETIDGGADIDTIDFGNNNAFGAVNLTAANISNVEILQLSANDVTLKASQVSLFETISGSFGVDRLFLSAPGTADFTNMTLNSIEEIRGTSGADVIKLAGVANGQLVNGLDGADSILGSAGVDTLNGGLANDTLAGNEGNDVIYGGDGVDSLSGLAGNDVFRVAFISEISGLAETIAGGADSDALDFATLGASGAVDLTHAVISSVETLSIATNDVTLTAAQLAQFTTISGGFGTDRIILAGAGTADFTGVTIQGIDEIRGSTGADNIYLTNVLNGQYVDAREGADNFKGSIGADSVNGNDGADTLSGGAGNDTMIGGQGADSMVGGVGYDVFQIQQVSDISGLAEKINGFSDVDTLDFAHFNAFGAVDLSHVTLTSVEVLTIANNDVTLTAAQMGGFDQFVGGFGAERLIMAAAGTANFSGATFSGIDEIRGTSGADGVVLTNVAAGLFVNGLGGADTLTGGNGADLLDGGSENDSIVGGAGADTILGGLGGDTLTGGAGADTFRYLDSTETLVTAGQRDVITDFVHGTDVLDLQTVDANTEVAGNQGFAFIGGDAFHHVAGELRVIAGTLYADRDGNGVSDLQISFSNGALLTAGDIML